MLLLALWNSFYVMTKRIFIHVFQFLTFKMWRIKCYRKSPSIRHIQATTTKKHTKMHITTFRKIKSCGLILDFLLSTSWGLQYAYYLVWKFSDSVLCELSDAYKIFAMRWNRTNNIVTKAKSAKTLIQQREHAKEVVSGMHTKLCTMCTRPIH
jgi:hypothetical protein